MFRLDAGSESRFPFFADVWENRFLFWAVIIGAFSVFPAVYIPGLNTSVFKHTGITWEWGLSFGAVIVFVLGIEAWKGIKRKFGLFEEGAEDRDESERQSRKLGLRQGFFSMAKARSSSIRSLSRRGTEVSDLSMKEKLAEMGSLSSAPTTRSLLHRPELHLGGKGTDEQQV